MALQNQLFSDIISGVAPVNPGIGGWDTLINQFMADRRGRHGMGLLGRYVNLLPDNSGSGTIIVTVPAGWQAFALCVLVTRAAGLPDGTYHFFVGSDLRAWNTAPANFAGLDDIEDALLVWPNPGASAFIGATPADIPFINGDHDPQRNTFRVRRIAGTSIALNFFVYGMAWQSSD